MPIGWRNSSDNGYCLEYGEEVRFEKKDNDTWSVNGDCEPITSAVYSFSFAAGSNSLRMMKQYAANIYNSCLAQYFI